jgi:hypothetical protein
MIEYIHSSAMNSTMLTPMHGTECKGLGKILGVVVGVVASIAVPFLAPVIGAALGGGFFASIAGQALIGAGIGSLGGAAGSAISGGDILKGALLGGAGGALTGGAGAFLGGAGLTTGAANTGAGAGVAGGGFQITAAGGEGLSTGLITGVDAVTGLPLATAGAAGAAGALAGTAPEAVVGTPAASTGVFGGLSTGFKTAAVQTLLNGGTQLLQTLQPDQQADLFKKMQAEMEVTRTQDQAAYAAQKKIFDEYYNFAKSINPTFFGELERANESQRLSSTWADTERSLREGGASQTEIAGERRRQEVQGAAGLNTSYAGGFMRGLNAQGSAYQTASNLYPKTPTGYSQNLKTMYDVAGDRENDRAAGIAGLVAPWQVYLQGKVEGSPNTKKQDRIVV